MTIERLASIVQRLRAGEPLDADDAEYLCKALECLLEKNRPGKDRLKKFASRLKLARGRGRPGPKYLLQVRRAQAVHDVRALRAQGLNKAAAIARVSEQWAKADPSGRDYAFRIEKWCSKYADLTGYFETESVRLSERMRQFEAENARIMKALNKPARK